MTLGGCALILTGVYLAERRAAVKKQVQKN